MAKFGDSTVRMFKTFASVLGVGTSQYAQEEQAKIAAAKQSREQDGQWVQRAVDSVKNASFKMDALFYYINHRGIMPGETASQTRHGFLLQVFQQLNKEKQQLFLDKMVDYYQSSSKNFHSYHKDNVEQLGGILYRLPPAHWGDFLKKLSQKKPLAEIIQNREDLDVLLADHHVEFGGQHKKNLKILIVTFHFNPGIISCSTNHCQIKID